MASGIRGCFTLGGFLIELTSDGSTPRFPSCVLLFFGLDARDLLLPRGLSRGFLPFGLRSRSLAASCFLTSGLLTLRLQLCCPRCLGTSRFLTSCQQTLRLQLCRNPSLGFDARRYFLASDLLPLRLQSCCSQLRDLLAFSLQLRSLDTCRFFPKIGLLTLRLQLCCSRCLDTCRFLTSCQQTLRLQLCRNPSRGFDARRCFLASGLLPLRLQSCCSQLRGLLAFSLQSRSLDTCRFLPKIGLPFRGLNPCRLRLIRLFRQFSSSLPNVLPDSRPC